MLVITHTSIKEYRFGTWPEDLPQDNVQFIIVFSQELDKSRMSCMRFFEYMYSLWNLCDDACPERLIDINNDPYIFSVPLEELGKCQ